MKTSEAVAIIKGRCSNYSSSTIDALIVTEMNARQKALEGGDFRPWFLLTESASTTNTASDERIPMPSDFIMEWEEGSMQYKLSTETEWSDLAKDDYDFLRERYGETAGAPKGYSEAGENFLIVPPPLYAYSWKMRYYAHQAANTLSPDSENNWLKYASDWLIAETGVIIASQYLNNKAAADAFSIQKSEAKARVEKLTVAKLEANRERMMGE